MAEKILGAEESLVESWAVQGTSGYEFINDANGAFIDSANEGSFTRLYQEWIEDDTRYADVVYEKKRLILGTSLASELHMLTYQLDRLAQKHRRSRDFTFNTLRGALREIIACFPVYRSYITDEGPHEADRHSILTAVRRAISRNPLLSRRVFDFIRDVLLQRSPEPMSSEEAAERRHFAGKFQQVTAPVTAKGVEDTAFYTYNRLMSLNEVGGDPGRFGRGPGALHAHNRERQRLWPYALSPLSTHDTKRSEDVRARLNVLSELPGEWRECLWRWRSLNEPYRSTVDDLPAPGPNEEYLFYQALVGGWPLKIKTSGEHEQFVARIQAYMEKALHEAKVHTSWINPNEEYDAAIREFVSHVLDPGKNGRFLEDFQPFQKRISHFGLWNSLAQTLLRITSPGVPDTYQGTEFWDFSLVDPDNRRPVDYEQRERLLEELDRDVLACNGDLRELVRGLGDAKEDGRIKLYVTSRALRCRRDHPGLFSAGEYLPLLAQDKQADHVVAFARRSGAKWAIVAVPRLLTRLLPDANEPPVGASVWGDTRLLLADVAPGLRWRHVLTGSVHSEDEERCLPLADLFADAPVALLMADASDGTS